MKKLLLIFTLVFAFGLAACESEDGDRNNNDEVTECEEGFELKFGECIEIEEELQCEEGFHEENGECVESTLECEEGFVEENGECVEIDTRVEVPTDASVYSSLNATSDTFDMFYFEEFVMDTTYITNVYSAYDESDMLAGYLFKATGDGRWGPVTYLITLDADGTILAFDVLESSENWGSFISLDSFQDQFDGMQIDYYLTNMFELGVDGNASATTTIPLTENVLKEVANLQMDEFN